MMTSLSLTTRSEVLSKRTSQLSSHSCPMDISKALLRLGRIIAVDVRSVRDEDNGRLPDLEGEILLPLGRRIDGPVLGQMLERTNEPCSFQ